MIVHGVAVLFELYFILILVRCFLSFIPKIDRGAQPTKFIIDITEPYLEWFRRIVPPVGGLDFSPIIAVVVLQILQVVVCSLLDIIF